MCEIKIYQPGDIADLGFGGILLHGSLVPMSMKADAAKEIIEQKLG